MISAVKRSQKDCIRPHTKAELDGLRESIKRDGPLGTVLKTPSGYIIDGRTLAQLCEELRLAYKIEIVTVDDEEGRRMRLAMNVHRRHLTKKEYAEVIAIEVKRTPLATPAEIGERLGICPKTVRRHRKRLGNMPSKLQGRDGKFRKPTRIVTTSKKADRLGSILENLPPSCDGKVLDDSTAIRLARVNRKKVDFAERIARLPPFDPEANQNLFNCRFQDLGRRVPSGSVDLILTDPLYSPEFLPQISELAAFGRRVLKNGGVLAMFIGKSHLPDIMRRLGEHLNYVWLGGSSWSHHGNQQWLGNGSNAVQKSTPVLIYCKGKWARKNRFIDHYHAAEPEREKDFHPYQKAIPEVAHWIKAFSDERDTVLDPCMGSGSVLVSARDLKRRFIGCDIDCVACKTAAYRLTSLSPIKTLSLFSGIGVGAAYARKCGVDVVLANELKPDRCEVHKHIYPETEIIPGDLRKENVASEVVRRAKELGVKLIVATPPCQGFSTLNAKQKHDPSNRLVFDFCKVVNEIAPDYVLLENVPQLLTARLGQKPILEILGERLLDYTLRHAVINAKHCETPQGRRRAIVLFSRAGLPVWDFGPLDESKPVLTLRDAIGDLESLDAGCESSTHKWHFARQHAANHILWLTHTPSGQSACENLEHFPSKNGRRIKSFANTYKRMDWDEPAPTLISRATMVSSSNTVHPGWKQSDGTFSDARTLSILEAMRVMGLPDDWPLPENVSYRRAMEYLGDGLCPKVLKYLASTLPVPAAPEDSLSPKLQPR